MKSSTWKIILPYLLPNRPPQEQGISPPSSHYFFLKIIWFLRVLKRHFGVSLSKIIYLFLHKSDSIPMFSVDGVFFHIKRWPRGHIGICLLFLTHFLYMRSFFYSQILSTILHPIYHTPHYYHLNQANITLSLDNYNIFWLSSSFTLKTTQHSF